MTNIMTHTNRDIDKIINELTLEIERLRNFLKNISQGERFCALLSQEASQSEKNESLAEAVKEAIVELEKSKKQFKSKTIKEVREKLIRALNE